MLAGLACLVAACSPAPQTRIQVQGTVRSIGFDLPIPGAEVSINWPQALGGGSNGLRTNREGRYAAGRMVRARRLRCDGLVLSVRAGGYASAYLQRSDTSCSQGVLTIDFKLFPLER
ncbi:MAG: carboxypeptidase regulatory-like domain-containing protein [Gemmatimonadetes bacterium]|nr:carboxypeptidase regulatory-like domain-containing protein [Gemmatimonadota bacterium]